MNVADEKVMAKREMWGNPHLFPYVISPRETITIGPGELVAGKRVTAVLTNLGRMNDTYPMRYGKFNVIANLVGVTEMTFFFLFGSGTRDRMVFVGKENADGDQNDWDSGSYEISAPEGVDINDAVLRLATTDKLHFIYEHVDSTTFKVSYTFVGGLNDGLSWVYQCTDRNLAAQFSITFGGLLTENVERMSVEGWEEYKPMQPLVGAVIESITVDDIPT